MPIDLMAHFRRVCRAARALVDGEENKCNVELLLQNIDDQTNAYAQQLSSSWPPASMNEAMQVYRAQSTIRQQGPRSLFKTLCGHRRQVRTLCWAGNFLVSGAESNDIKVWDMASSDFKCVRTMTGHTDMVLCLVVSPYGQLLSGSVDKSIKVWDVKTWTCERTLTDHTGSIFDLKTYGTKVVSGSFDHTIRVWNALTWECEQTLEKAHFKRLVFVGGKMVSMHNNFGFQKLTVWNTISFRDGDSEGGGAVAQDCRSSVSTSPLPSSSSSSSAPAGSLGGASNHYRPKEDVEIVSNHPACFMTALEAYGDAVVTGALHCNSEDDAPGKTFDTIKLWDMPKDHQNENDDRGSGSGSGSDSGSDRRSDSDRSDGKLRRVLRRTSNNMSNDEGTESLLVCGSLLLSGTHGSYEVKVLNYQGNVVRLLNRANDDELDTFDGVYAMCMCGDKMASTGKNGTIKVWCAV
jgi:WD40 repeat protein